MIYDIYSKTKHKIYSQTKCQDFINVNILVDTLIISKKEKVTKIFLKNLFFQFKHSPQQNTPLHYKTHSKIILKDVSFIS